MEKGFNYHCNFLLRGGIGFNTRRILWVAGLVLVMPLLLRLLDRVSRR